MADTAATTSRLAQQRNHHHQATFSKSDYPAASAAVVRYRQQLAAQQEEESSDGESLSSLTELYPNEEVGEYEDDEEEEIDDIEEEEEEEVDDDSEEEEDEEDEEEDSGSDGEEQQGLMAPQKLQGVLMAHLVEAICVPTDKFVYKGIQAALAKHGQPEDEDRYLALVAHCLRSLRQNKHHLQSLCVWVRKHQPQVDSLLQSIHRVHLQARCARIPGFDAAAAAGRSPLKLGAVVESLVDSVVGSNRMYLASACYNATLDTLQANLAAIFARKISVDHALILSDSLLPAGASPLPSSPSPLPAPSPSPFPTPQQPQPSSLLQQHDEAAAATAAAAYTLPTLPRPTPLSNSPPRPQESSAAAAEEEMVEFELPGGLQRLPPMQRREQSPPPPAPRRKPPKPSVSFQHNNNNNNNHPSAAPPIGGGGGRQRQTSGNNNNQKKQLRPTATTTRRHGNNGRNRRDNDDDDNGDDEDGSLSYIASELDLESIQSSSAESRRRSKHPAPNCGEARRHGGTSSRRPPQQQQQQHHLTEGALARHTEVHRQRERAKVSRHGVSMFRPGSLRSLKECVVADAAAADSHAPPTFEFVDGSETTSTLSEDSGKDDKEEEDDVSE